MPDGALAPAGARPPHIHHTTGPPIHHFDLYRLEAPSADLGRLDMAASFAGAVALVEWPERLPAALVPAERLEVAIDILSEVWPMQPRLQLQPLPESAATRFCMLRCRVNLVEGHPRNDCHGPGLQLFHPTPAMPISLLPSFHPQTPACALSFLPQKEQQALMPQHEAAAGAMSPGADAASSSGSDDGGDWGEEGEEGDEWGDEEDPYADQRWRSVHLRAVGSGWAARLATLLERARSQALSRHVIMLVQEGAVGSGSSGSGSAA
jgi:hypothetical protein